jgi:long-chain acyl-CoA synthetase
MIRITQPVRTAVQQRPDEVAVIFEERRQSWASFADRVARLAGALAAMGIGPGDRVAILAENSDRYLECFYGVPWAGAILVPVNTRLSPSELAYVVNHSEPSVLFVDNAMVPLWSRVEPLLDRPIHVVRLDDRDGYEALISAAEPIADRSEGGDQVAALFYTGGTTGRAKGVMMSHANHIVNGLALWAALQVDPRQVRYLHTAPMFHVADALFVHGITLAGACHVIVPAFDPVPVMEAIARHRITDTILVPTMIQKLLDAPERQSCDLSSLERLHYGAAPMPEALAARVMQALPQIGLVQLYGQTEAGPVITMLDPEGHRPPTEKRTRVKSAGRPLPGIEIAIADPDGTMLPQGEVGEIFARSGGVMQGYWRDEEQSAQTLRHGWLHTGDGGYLDEDGFLFISDRLKDMIISGGENIYSIEVERAIHLFPGVAQCAVIGLPDPQWGERVHAIIVPQPGAVIDAEAVRQHCRGHIAGFKCPRSIDIRQEPLPLSGAGKILKRELRQSYLDKIGLEKVS